MTQRGSGDWTTTTGAFPLLRLVLLVNAEVKFPTFADLKFPS
jgi:hypothetical protein